MKISKLDSKGYRKFGIVTGAIFALLFGLLIPWLFNLQYPMWPWIVAAILSVLGLSFPMVLEPVYLVWMKFGGVMNWINTRLILGILFYCIFFPVGVLLKVLGKDPMKRKLNNKIVSYRKLSHQARKSDMEHPY